MRESGALTIGEIPGSRRIKYLSKKKLIMFKRYFKSKVFYTELMALFLFLCVNAVSAQEKGISVDFTPEKKAVSADDPDVIKLKEMDKVFRAFVKDLHGEDPQRSKQHLSDMITDQVGPDNIVALSKSIRRDSELITVSEKMELDLNHPDLKLITYRYKVDTEPAEVLQIRFDMKGKICGINSTRPNK